MPGLEASGCKNITPSPILLAFSIKIGYIISMRYEKGQIRKTQTAIVEITGATRDGENGFGHVMYYIQIDIETGRRSWYKPDIGHEVTFYGTKHTKILTEGEVFLELL